MNRQILLNDTLFTDAEKENKEKIWYFSLRMIITETLPNGALIEKMSWNDAVNLIYLNEVI